MTAVAIDVDAASIARYRPYSDPDYQPRPMRVRCGWDSAIEAEAQEWAGQVRLTTEDNCGGNQPWTPVADERPAPGGHKFRTIEGVVFRHISESRIFPSPVPWLPKGLLRRSDAALLGKVSREYDCGDEQTNWSGRDWVASVMPEPERLPDYSPINGMAFDEKPWLDTMPLEDFAKVGYSNFDNDKRAKGTGVQDSQGRWHWQGLEPGTTWRDHDRAHRKAGVQKLASSDASQPPGPPEDSLSSLTGCSCKGCIRRFDPDHGLGRYCSERCRNRSEGAARRGKIGTVGPGIQLTNYAVDGKRVGASVIDGVDPQFQAFIRLVAQVTSEEVGKTTGRSPSSDQGELVFSPV